jgi:hypothetical protein
MTEIPNPLEALRAARVSDENVRQLAELLVVEALVGSGRAVTARCCWLIQPPRATTRNRSGYESGGMSAAYQRDAAASFKWRQPDSPRIVQIRPGGRSIEFLDNTRSTICRSPL